LLAFLGAAIGVLVGVVQIKVSARRPALPHRGAKALHHWLGLICAPFVLTWIFSGWLSMDQGRLFSTGEPSAAERAAMTGAPDWEALAAGDVERIAGPVREVEWFALGGRMFRRERIALDRQRLFVVGTSVDAAAPDRASLQADEIATAARGLGSACQTPAADDPGDAYAPVPAMPGAPLFRVVCGDDWFYLDAASGALLEKLDRSRRAYRWLFRGLHTLDFPVLTARPALRATLIVGLCAAGLSFSLIAVAIAWRRLALSLALRADADATA
jgi:uncharacterized iron-regulated membrane protein